MRKLIRGINLRLLQAILACAAIGASALSANAANLFTGLYSFGDSLTDSGNVAAATGGTGTYPSGRFSDGATWAEYLATDHMGLSSHGPSSLGGGNHAWGGAWTDGGGAVPTVLQQIGFFISGGGSFQPTDLVTLWAGANDFFGTVMDLTGPVSPTIPVANIGSALGMLAGAGAQNVLVLNMPDLGATPQLQGLAAATDWTTGFNSLLGAELAVQRGGLGITIHEADIFTLSRDISLNPGNYGLTNSTDPVLPGLTLDPATTAYWDEIHPTTVVHKLFAAEAWSSIPEPSVGLLAVLGCGLLVGRRSRVSPLGLRG